MAKKKNYALVGKTEDTIFYKEYRTPTKDFIMRGTATISLWGGGTGSIEMDTVEFQADELTKAVIYANLNDGQFGCEDINSANVTIEQKIAVNRVHIDPKTLTTVKSVDVEQYEEVVCDLYVSHKDFDEAIGHPCRRLKGAVYNSRS